MKNSIDQLTSYLFERNLTKKPQHFCTCTHTHTHSPPPSTFSFVGAPMQAGGKEYELLFCFVAPPPKVVVVFLEAPILLYRQSLFFPLCFLPPSVKPIFFGLIAIMNCEPKLSSFRCRSGFGRLGFRRRHRGREVVGAHARARAALFSIFSRAIRSIFVAPVFSIGDRVCYQYGPSVMRLSSKHISL